MLTREETLAGYLNVMNSPNNDIRATRASFIETLNDLLLLDDSNSYSFSQLGLGHLCGVKDFRKYVNSFKYTNKAGKVTERFSRESIDNFILDNSAIDSLLLISNTEKYLKKFRKKIARDDSPFSTFRYHGKIAICFEFAFPQFIQHDIDSPRHYISDGMWVVIDGGTVSIEDDEYSSSDIVGYLYAPDEIF